MTFHYRSGVLAGCLLLMSPCASAQAPSAPKASQARPKKKAAPAPVRIPPIESLFLPYPETYSIPVKVQEAVVQLIQGKPELEQRWRDLYREEGRLKGFLRQFTTEGRERHTARMNELEGKEGAYWNQIAQWKTQLNQLEAPIQGIRQGDFTTIHPAFNGLAANRDAAIANKNKLGALVEQGEAMERAYGSLMDRQTRQANLDARIKGLQTMQYILGVLPVLEAKMRDLTALLVLHKEWLEVSIQRDPFLKAEEPIKEWAEATPRS
ncbi:MAG TPA: hypothetical protein VK188_04215 [Holophaga sp.]|nr:hypothetical protein [Holophaga sp.]